MINEDKENALWPPFLIDLDLAIREQRDGVSRATVKTAGKTSEKIGTRAFVVIDLLLGEKHSLCTILNHSLGVLLDMHPQRWAG